VQQTPPSDTQQRSRAAAVWHYTRWGIFYFGFMVSPLALWNDPILNQLPSAVTAAFLIRYGVVTGVSYGMLYIACYVATNIIGIILMLVNIPVMRQRWRKLVELRRRNPARFVGRLSIDVFFFVALYFLGRYAVSLT
jgi:hypothetical protein